MSQQVGETSRRFVPEHSHSARWKGQRVRTPTLYLDGNSKHNYFIGLIFSLKVYLDVEADLDTILAPSCSSDAAKVEMALDFVVRLDDAHLLKYEAEVRAFVRCYRC